MTERACIHTHTHWTSWLFFCFVFLIVVKYTQSYLHLLAVVSSAAVNSGAHVSFRVVVFSGFMLSSGIARSRGRLIPSLLRKLHPAFHNGCISLHAWKVDF